MRIKVLDVDLAAGPRDQIGLQGYRRARVLARWRGRPLGVVELPVTDGCLSGWDLWRAVEAESGLALSSAAAGGWLGAVRRPAAAELPTASVVVGTRDRPDDLAACLAALLCAWRPGVEIIVVDNAPSSPAAARVAAGYPVRYVCEPRPGQNWARARGARVATGEVVMFTDDDVRVDAGWVDALRSPFVESDVAAATGLVLPLELENQAQIDFERYASFGRGCTQRDFTYQNLMPVAAGAVGAGASMAFRRTLVNRLGLFAVELDGGTPARAGGDTYAFYRVLAAGGRIVYTPAAVAWHRHRQSPEALRRVLEGYSLGTMVVLLRCLLEHGETQALYAAAWWLRHHHWQRLWGAAAGRFPWRLALAELRGCLAAPAAYLACRRRERAVPDRRADVLPCSSAS